MNAYTNAYEAWGRDPAGFWSRAAGALDWFEAPSIAFDPEAGVYGRWFPDGRLNACHNCIDRHVEGGRRGQPALIYDSPVTGTKRSYTYEDLLHEVQAMAWVLRDHGVSKGDRVVLYMPMVPEAVVAMMACARLGAIHSVVFGGFSAAELAARIDDAGPKLIVSASCGLEGARVVPYKPLLDAALAASSHAPDACLILQRPQAEASLKAGRDQDLAPLLAEARAEGHHLPCTPMLATDPLYILYTSGTTGRPKGVVRDTGGYLAALQWSMENLYGLRPGEVFWTASDIGWVVGHSYIVYGPLLAGCASVLYEGKPVGTPDAGAFWRVADEHDVAALFTAPTALRAIKKEDPQALLAEDHDLTTLRTLFLAGERADPNTVRWAGEHLDVPIIDHWWQTETGWGIAGNPVGLERLPEKPGSTAVPMPGFDVRVLSEAGEEMPAGEMGALAIKLPLPPGCLPTLWRDEARFRESYLATYPGYYETSDAGYRDADGYIFVMGRTDDVINTAGHRLSTGAMEEVLSDDADVAECAVIGVHDALKGQVPVGFVVLKSGRAIDEATLQARLVAAVRERIGPVAAFKRIKVVSRLPKTRSGKILRATMRAIADGETYRMPATIEDPTVLDEIAAALKPTELP